MENQKEKPKRKIDTCYNFNKETGCVQIDCRCEKEKPLYDYGWCKGNVVLPQETLEETAENFWLNNDSMTDNDRISYVNGFVTCAKFAEKRLYTEEDMRKAFIAGGNSFIEEDDAYGSEYRKYMNNWFENFKKK